MSSFYQIKAKKIIFKKCSIQEVDFSESILSSSIFESCDLLSSTFDNTNLENVDFRTSFNYIIDPEKNIIKNANFSVNGLSGLLEKYKIKISL